ncbi:hypothetical protein KDA00_02215 [Candidatus Saccharibacteria bacterium]|nr:hypothetical protein [Candidatus Saccharibacteria bacterium]
MESGEILPVERSENGRVISDALPVRTRKEPDNPAEHTTIDASMLSDISEEILRYDTDENPTNSQPETAED